MCSVLAVSRSSFYKYFSYKESNRSKENKMLKEKILEIYRESKNRYGAPKIQKVLKDSGIKISLKRTQKLMKSLGIRSIIIKKFRPTSSKSKVESRENVLKRDFSTNTINEKWVTDRTYIHTLKDGWCYLASVLDLYSKKIIGYAMSKTMTSELAVQAVRNAILLQRPKAPLILHSDLGSQYTSYEFQKYISETKIITHSFSGKGCPYDNACIESFHASLKKEEVNLVKYYDFNTARLSVFEYIESWYNRKRLHSSIGYITPQKCEDLARKTA
jgi:putative transposase